MRIDSITIARVSLPLIYPHRTAYGSDHEIDSILLRLGSGEYHAWGESTPLRRPTYSPESAMGAFLVAKEFLAPRLIGKEIHSARMLQDDLADIKGNYFAKAAFDLAWWNLHAKMLNQPLWKLIGGKDAEVEAGADFGVMENTASLIKAIENAVHQGYRRIKLKYCPMWGLEMIKDVRRFFPDITIHIDCNSAYTLADTEMFKELDQYRLAMIEQPLGHDDLIDHAQLQSELKTPICLDESITSIDRARKAIQLKSCRWINVKHGRVGGLTNALAILELAADKNIPCWIGSMLESAIGMSFSLALASTANIKYPSDIFPQERLYKQDLGFPFLTHSSPSRFKLSNQPGIGVEVLEEIFEKYLLDRVDFTSPKPRRTAKLIS